MLRPPQGDFTLCFHMLFKEVFRTTPLGIHDIMTKPPPEPDLLWVRGHSSSTDHYSRGDQGNLDRQEMQCRDRSGDQREAPGRYHTPKDLLEKVGGRDSNICRFPDIGNSGVYGITRTSHWWCGTAHQEVSRTSHGWPKRLGRPQGRPKHTPCPPKAAPSIMKSCEDNLHQARKIISCMCGFLKAPRKRRQVEWSLVSFPRPSRDVVLTDFKLHHVMSFLEST